MNVILRPIRKSDLPTIAQFPFTVSIEEPLESNADLLAAFEEHGFWGESAGARAIEADGRLVGTCQFYRSAPCIHGFEIGYIIHDARQRGHGYASQALQAFTDLLMRERPKSFRLQLIIEVWNTPSWHVAERCGYVREGLMRSAGFGANDPSDCFIYSRTRKDWHEQSTAGPSMGGASEVS